jgi:hypothetical protein
MYHRKEENPMSQVPPTPQTTKAVIPVAHAPTLSDFVSAFFTGSPLLPANLYAWVGFLREIAVFLILDSATSLFSAFEQNKTFDVAFFIILGLQIAYIIVNLIWRVLRAMNSPLAPIFKLGIQFFDDLIIRRGGMIPDLADAPAIPGATTTRTTLVESSTTVPVPPAQPTPPGPQPIILTSPPPTPPGDAKQ